MNLNFSDRKQRSIIIFISIFGGVLLFSSVVIFIDARGRVSNDTSGKVSTPGVVDDTLKVSDNNQSVSEISTYDGKFVSYDNSEYRYILSKNDNNNLATFTPVLPRDDRHVVLAILELLGTTYGNNAVINPTPETAVYKDKNYITFEGNGVRYYALLIKEDTGEVNSIQYFLMDK